MGKICKVLQLGKAYPLKGGVETVLFGMMQALNNTTNFKCDALCAATGNKRIVNFIYGGKVIATPTLIKMYATYISPKMILELFRIRKSYDIIHIHHPDPMSAVALFFSTPKSKIVLHWHSDIVKQKKLLYFYKPLQNWLLKKASKIICTTPVYPKYSNHLKKVQHKIEIVPIGIDRIPPPSLKNNKKQEKKIIFSLGRLVFYKGFEYLIKAALYLPEDYQILIGGEGKLKESLSKLISEKKLTKKVQLLGKLSEDAMIDYYHSCDMFCLPSIQKTEAFGVVLLEAMSCGKPLLATRIEGSGIVWVNKHGETGLNVPIKNPKAIAHGIRRIIEDKKTYARYSKNAKRRFESFFTKEKMKNKILSIYKDLL